MVLFSGAFLGLCGCARIEPVAEPRAPAAVEPDEPNEGGVRPLSPPAAAACEPNEVDASSGEAQQLVADEADEAPADEPGSGMQIPAGPNGFEGEAPPTSTVPEPNHVEMNEPDEAPAPREPNDATARVDESPTAAGFLDQYGAILNTYVREDGLVDYGSLRRRRLDLKPILTVLDELDPNVYQGWSQPEKLAFWIDAYNLKMLEIIARNYPIESSWWLRLTWPPSDLRHIRGIWTDYRFIVMEEEFTLTEVEQRFFRRQFGDPRVFLALTYACQSSPALDRRPYRGDDLDRRLNEQVKRFLASPQGVQIDRRNRVVRLSALFKPSWRGKEFVARYGTDKKFKSRDPETRAVLSFLTNYLPPEDVEFLEVENYAIEYLNFDWRLNDTAKGY